MKTVYIPKGKTQHFEMLCCEDIVVHGALIVEKTIQARRIMGKGVLNAGTVSARSVTVMDAEASEIITQSLCAERVCAAEIRVSGAAVVSCSLDAEYVEAEKLTVGMCHVGELHAKEVINLSDKKRSVIGALIAAFFSGLWVSLTHRVPKEETDTSASEVTAPVSTAGSPEDAVSAGIPRMESDAPDSGDGPMLEDDFEFLRLKAMWPMLREHGYIMRLVPVEEIGSYKRVTVYEAAEPMQEAA